MTADGVARWRKSTRSTTETACVEVAQDTELAAIRDSKDASGPVLTFAPGALAAFLAQVRTGRFDR